MSAEEIFRRVGAVLEGHFLLTSGLHSPQYWEKAQVLQYPPYTELLCHFIVDHFRDKGVQVVAGPTVGGVILAYEVARQMGVRAIFAEREGEGRAFRRGFTVTPGERVLIVDDILTTGGSLRQMVDAVAAIGGKTVGIGILVDRSPDRVDVGVPLFSCHRAVVPTFKAGAETCPQCRAGIPLTKRGSSA
ncbi:MAG: orotate phosphoribosyltransferase [Chloroflexi bacterium]|nr:orotate phosphoribosyltransferase [Chloroflexota bacterium]